VSPENFMLFASMLPEAASGTLEPRHVVVPLRLMCPHADLVLGRAVSHDPGRQRVQVETENGLVNIRYTDLVVALGAIPRTVPVPGLTQYAMGFKDLADAIALRNHVLQRLEAAAAAPTEAHRRRELSFVFVGAGYAGVEALAELSDLVRDAVRYYPSLRSTPQHWVLVDAAPKILPEIPSRLGEYAAEQLTRRGIDVRVSTTLQALEPHAAILSDGDRILASTFVWTTGARPHPLVGEFDLPLDERGRIRVGPTLQVEGQPHVWALGDCANVPNEASDAPDPPTSQHALRQARRLAKNLKGEPKPYRYRMLGQVATLGRHKGIAEVLGLKLRGFPAWWVTRTYHLYQLPTFSRKLRVVTDWTVALLFRRDIAELGQLGHPRPLGDA
jgi:NADH dehydrogenase